ncbi:MAG TPA: VCBS repeat-containing protein, partial [Polyangia bacterium]
VIAGGLPGGSPDVTVLVSKAGGTFAPPAVFATGDTGGSVAVALQDLNGDALLDLAVGADGAAPAVSVLMGRGDGSFAAGSIVGPGSIIGFADMNGDHGPDLIATQPYGAAVEVMLAGRSTLFGDAREYVASYAPGPMALADLNGDGRVDVAVADEFHVTVFLGGDSGVLPTATHASFGGSVAMAVADLNGDGRADVAGIETDGLTSTLKITLRVARGDAYAVTTEYPAQFSAYALATGDVDGDGVADVVVANHDDATVSVYRNRGNGSMMPPVAYAAEAGTSAVALADVDRDGRLDLIAVNRDAASVVVLRNAGGGLFASAVRYATGADPFTLAIADVDGDGAPDLAVVDVAPATVSVLLNQGGGTFAPKVDVPLHSSPPDSPDALTIAAGDLDGDGRADLVVPTSSGDLDVLRSVGGGAFAPIAAYPTRSLGSVRPALGDIDRDGKLDVVLADYSGTVSVLLNNGDATFGRASNYAAGGTLGQVAITDLDGDGKPDIVVSASGGFNVLRNTTR